MLLFFEYLFFHFVPMPMYIHFLAGTKISKNTKKSIICSKLLFNLLQIILFLWVIVHDFYFSSENIFVKKIRNLTKKGVINDYYWFVPMPKNEKRGYYRLLLIYTNAYVCPDPACITVIFYSYYFFFDPLLWKCSIKFIKMLKCQNVFRCYYIKI